MQSFKEKVLTIVKSIPKGKTMTYGAVAEKAGRPRTARAVGTFLAENCDPRVPCHRVVRADGTLGKYNGLRGRDKSALLKEEGALV